MAQAQYDAGVFPYGTVTDASGIQVRVAIYADRTIMREEMAQDLCGAGFRVVDGGDIANLIEGDIAILGDVVMVECPAVDVQSLAALSRLDMRVAQAGAQLIVSTSLGALDDVFAALDQCNPHILVNPSRADRVVAAGRTLSAVSGAQVNELTREDRLSLLHLSRQVDAIAHELDRLSSLSDGDTTGAQGRLGEPNSAFKPSQDNPLLHYRKGDGTAQPSLPDPRHVRRIIAARQARAKFFDGDLFADPAWDMLLDLTAAHAEDHRVSVTSLCIAAAVPATTALRWLRQMVDSGVFVRVEDPEDRRRAFIGLSDSSLQAMARYFAEVDLPLAHAA